MLLGLLFILFACEQQTEILNILASEKLQAKDYKKAIDITGEILKEDTSKAGVYNVRGIAFYELHNHDLCVESLTKSITLDSSNFSSFYFRGKAFLELNKIDKAIDDFNHAINLRKDNPELYHSRGLVFFNSGDYSKALEDFSIALAFEKKDEKIWCNRGKARLMINDHYGASKDFKEALNINKLSWTPYYGLAMIDFVLGNKESGCVYLEKAISLGGKEIAYAKKNFCDSLNFKMIQKQSFILKQGIPHYNN